jgi:hypothetical protein
MMNKNEFFKALIADPVVQQRLAKYIVLNFFRNSVLEYLNAGIAPDSKTGDFSDVTVLTSKGEIPWNEVSRIHDAEMKAIMDHLENEACHLIHELFDKERGGEILLQLAAHDPAPEWDNPK